MARRNPPIGQDSQVDYGADPLGDGTFRMVPSGDIVGLAERRRRLQRFGNPSGLVWRVEVYVPLGKYPARTFSRLSKSEAEAISKQVLAQARTLGWKIRVRMTDQTSRKNPLTRRETATVLREAKQDMRLAKRAPSGTPARAYRLGRVDVGQAIAYQHGEAKLRRMRGREFLMNPRVIGTIPGRMTRIEYQRTGQHPGRYYHNFLPGVSARVLSDGSVLLQGPRRLHVKE